MVGRLFRWRSPSVRSKAVSPLSPTHSVPSTISPPHPYHLSLGEVWGVLRNFKGTCVLGRELLIVEIHDAATITPHDFLQWKFSMRFCDDFCDEVLGTLFAEELSSNTMPTISS